MDVWVLVRDIKLTLHDFCIEEDGLILNIKLTTEFDFKRHVEKSLGGDFSHSMLMQARVIHTKDESITSFLADFTQVGADDRALTFFQLACDLISRMEKIEKWLTVKEDPLYAQLWALKAAEEYANAQLVLDNKPTSREAILKVMAYAPEKMRPLYERPMQGFMTREEVETTLAFYRSFLIENLDLLKQPIISYMADGIPRTITTLTKHFRMWSHGIYHIFDFLEEMGIVARVTENTRLTPKSRNTVEEVAFIYIENMTSVCC